MKGIPRMRAKSTTAAALPLIRAGDKARDERRWADAAQAYQAALELAPKKVGIWVQLGHARKEAGDLDGAGEAYRRSLSLDPNIADTHLQLGHLLKMQSRTGEAAECYIRAAELDPSLRHALDELRHLSSRGVPVDTRRLSEALETATQDRASRRPARRTARMADVTRHLESALARADNGGAESRALADTIRRGLDAARALEGQRPSEGQDVAARLVFDISDLVAYFDAARLPTGIQRVQIEVISALLADPAPGVEVSVCSFYKDRDTWMGVPPDLFLALAELSLLSGNREDEAWIAALDELKLAIELGAPFAFPQDAYLINLGTSWWLQNYFLHVRQAKERFGVRYVPFVHDMIPIMTPEHCVRELTQDFISWALGVFSHADHFLSNSESSKRDLLTVAERLGHTVDPDDIHVVRLDADFRKAAPALPIRDTLSRYGLTEGGYVLFVSTIESRKNHLNAFRAWLALIARHGARKVPKLVCVGNRGWLNDEVFAKLDASAELRARVLMTSGVSDPDLANLYRACAFTLYPSTYEGWGLPVTESLSWGKAVLLSDASSLPEAGGDLGVYFKVGDQDAFVAQLERLMFDIEWRTALEARIAREFKPRPWRSLGVEIAETLAGWSRKDQGRDAVVIPRPTLGRYYWMRRVNETAIHRGMTASEIFRSGDGWWHPDDWGVWTKRQGGVLKLNLDQAEGRLRLFIGLMGLGRTDTGYKVTVGGAPVREGHLKKGMRRWLSVPVSPDTYATGALQVGVQGHATEDFAIATKGVDRRLAAVGLIGFMICRDDDLAARVDFLEARSLNQLEDLADGWGLDA